ncbi:hypothetical protein DFJ73DRAFT_216052 [Zopfochytrium polystomum]|nr:hypothetical protein DFJ73DRAFT_216052 [Zopfochytrium polystomum]
MRLFAVPALLLSALFAMAVPVLAQTSTATTTATGSSSSSSGSSSASGTATATSSAATTTTTTYPVTVVKPLKDTVVALSDTLTITWTVNDNTLSTAQLQFDLEDLRNGVSTGKPISPTIGTVAASALTFTSAKLSTLFPTLTSGTNFTIRCQISTTQQYVFSPQFTIQGVSTSTSSSAVPTSSSSPATTSSKSGAMSTGRVGVDMAVAAGAVVAAALLT